MSEYRNSVACVGVADAHDLIAALAGTDPGERQQAREALIAQGRSAVAPLIRLLDDARPRVRREAVKALAGIGDRAPAPALIGALEDEEGDVRLGRGRCTDRPRA